MKSWLVVLLMVSAFAAGADDIQIAPTGLDKITYTGVFGVTGRLKVKLAEVDKFKSHLPALERDIRKEDGNILVTFSESVEDTGDYREFFFYGEWGSKQAFVDHIPLPHSKKFQEAIASLLVEPPKFSYMKKVRY